MSANQTTDLGPLLLLLVLGFVGMGAGFGFLWSAGSSSKKEAGGGMNAGKVVFILVFGLAAVTWLAAPGTGQGIAATINAMWGNIVTGVQPVVAIVTQLAMVAVICTVGYYLIRHFFRRR
jgi:hypothetical protein